MSDKTTVELPTYFGVKAGMTRIFDDNGNHVPVTVIKLVKNFISQVKTQATDGYEAYQVAYGEKREKLVNKPLKGILAKAKIETPLTRYSEVRIEGVNSEDLGKEVSLDAFPADTYIDVTGISKGKGFQGVIKRHNFSGGPGAHGSKFHRTTGSIGNRATPGRVFPGKKMPGHMGAKTTTVQNIKIQELNLEKGYLLIKGSVPGAKNSFVKISKSVKK
ncbi:MAG: 50S ribosomal protein L3 [Epsilonproteobacteria bacterium]|nr:MAG: 50S ribosomal protein L3 [Campylobacterota bacterium]RLA66516.1 MAG: 50S ribosomal protein L3 [Campylobacterota bacterium]